MRFREARRCVGAYALVGLLCLVSAAQNTHTRRATFPAVNNENSSLIARGKYIVDNVAICSQCHTPLNAQGQLDTNRWLEGAPVRLQPPRPNAEWPLQAPRIAGNPPGTDSEMVKLLTTGLWRNNEPLRPPMPQFHMSDEDARAVVAYLKSLTPKP
jgi:mono/diheme cytochrome c family protein